MRVIANVPTRTYIGAATEGWNKKQHVALQWSRLCLPNNVKPGNANVTWCQRKTDKNESRGHGAKAE